MFCFAAPQRRRKRWQFQERGQDTDIPFEDPAGKAWVYYRLY